MLKNILVPIDFSNNALNGLRIACEIGQKFNAKLHLMSAFNFPAAISDLGGAPQVIGSFISDYKQEVEESLDELENYVPELANAEYDKEVFLATTIDAIHTAIENMSIDLVVMGTRKSHRGLEHLLGGVSTDVIRFAKCPVLVIPELFGDFDPKEITIAIDYKAFKEMGRLLFLNDFCKTYDTKLRIVHVGDENDKLNEEQVEEINDLVHLFDGIDLTFETVHGTKVKESLINYVDENNQDLLVMMPRRHDLFERIFGGSKTKEMALDIQIPLLSIHE